MVTFVKGLRNRGEIEGGGYLIHGSVSFATAKGITFLPARLWLKAASRASVASFFALGAKWLYLSVMLKLLWPKSSLIVNIGVP